MQCSRWYVKSHDLALSSFCNTVAISHIRIFKFYSSGVMNVAETCSHKLQVTMNGHSQSLQSMKIRVRAVRGLL